jgi:AcrR family transcriptional regulator
LRGLRPDASSCDTSGCDTAAGEKPEIVAGLRPVKSRAQGKQGVASTTIDQITSRADVAKGTFYLHFSSRDDLLVAFGEQFANRHLGRITAAIARKPEADWIAKLATWAEASVTFYLDSIRLHDMLFYESRSPTRQSLVDNVAIDHLSVLLEVGAVAGAWSIDDARFTAVFLFSGMHAVVDDAYLRQRRIVRSRLIGRMQRICHRAVGLSGDISGI